MGHPSISALADVLIVLEKPLKLLQQRLAERQADEFDFNAPLDSIIYDHGQYIN